MTDRMTLEDLRRRVGEIRWFHSINFGNSVVSEGLCPLPDLHERMDRLPLLEIEGRSILDVGAWDGFYTFEAERRGARVTAVDSYCWGGPGWGTRDGFDLAHAWFGSRAKAIEVDILDISEDTVGRHDIVLFLGVLYHMRYPLLALEKVVSVADEKVILETLVDLDSVKEPACAFYPNKEVDGDSTNWWGPNPPAVLRLMEVAGLEDCKMVCRHVVAGGKDRAVFSGRVHRSGKLTD